MFFQEVMTLWQTDISDRHKNVFDEKIVYLVTFFHNSKENTAKYWSQCIENRLLKELYKYIMKRKKPSTTFWECRCQNVLDALGNYTKASFQKNIPGKIQFQKKKRVLTPTPPHYPHPVLSSLGGGGGGCSRVLSLFYHASHSNIDQIEWMPLYCLDNLSRFQTWFGKMFGYSETFWGKKYDWLANLLKSHI